MAKKYISGSQGMGANQAFDRIRKNINKNVNAKIRRNEMKKKFEPRKKTSSSKVNKKEIINLLHQKKIKANLKSW